MLLLEPVVAERRLLASMRNSESRSIRNRIHTTSGAREFGFRGALLGGITLYGWCAPVILEAAGPDWLTHGWADLDFRAPIYPGDAITLRAVKRSHDYGLEVLRDDATCVAGSFGSGDARWLGDLAPTPHREPERELSVRPHLTLTNAPSGGDLRTLAVDFSPAVVAKVARDDLGSDDARFAGKDPLVHPALIARQMIALLAHSYEYGRPSIHVRSRVQHLGEVRAGRRYTLGGRFLRAWERGGHHYAEFDGSLYSPAGDEVARMRHTNIFQVARRR